MLWVCENCGFHCSDSLDTCPDCGAPRSAGAAVVEAAAPVAAAGAEPARKSGKSRK